jgi:cytochrome c oxidase cbb3-type subunit III
MRYLTLLLAAAAMCLSAQEPDTVAATTAAIAGSKENPAAVDRGGKLFLANCAGCHGATAKGGAGAPDLIRSLLVIEDEKGILISPVLRDGRPDKGMPRSNLTEPQIADIVAWLHVQIYAADHRTTYAFQNVVTGDPKKGEVYFQSKCSGCHTVAGDLAGVGKRYEPLALQTRWLQPRGRSTTTVKVTLPSGETFTGVLDRIDDFNISLHDTGGEYHSFSRDGEIPKVEINNPLKAHTDLLRTYTDTDIHDVTAYLVTIR